LTRVLHEEDLRSGNQILIVTFPSLENEDAVDYTNRLFKYWNPGQKGKDNGVLLAVFLKEHKIRIEVGYGLEPILTDALTKRIIVTSIAPRFQQGLIDQGLIEGAQSVITTLKTGTPGQGPPPRRGSRGHLGYQFALIMGLILLIRAIQRTQQTTTLTSRRRDPFDSGFGGFGGFGSGGGWSSGGGSGGDGGGFSGGGGMSGGGGASGDW
jgi:uncharacterized protein